MLWVLCVWGGVPHTVGGARLLRFEARGGEEARSASNLVSLPPPHPHTPHATHSAALATVGASGLNAAAARAGLTPSQVRAALASDGDLGVAPGSGALAYACRGLVIDGAGAARMQALAAARLSSSSGPEIITAAAGSSDGLGSTLAPPATPAAAALGGGSGVSVKPLAALLIGGNNGSAPDPGGADPAPVDPALVLRLHSRPSAPKRILLDFDGAPYLIQPAPLLLPAGVLSLAAALTCRVSPHMHPASPRVP